MTNYEHPKYDEGILELLVEIMARVKSGEVTAISIIGECAGTDQHFTGTAGEFRSNREVAAQHIQLALLHLGFLPSERG